MFIGTKSAHLQRFAKQKRQENLMLGKVGGIIWDQTADLLRIGALNRRYIASPLFHHGT